MEKDVVYVVPQVEIIEVEVEKGFAGSFGSEGNGIDNGLESN